MTTTSDELPRCIGYGERDCRRADRSKHCRNPANTPARLWCEECEAERRRTISAQMGAIKDSLERASRRA